MRIMVASNSSNGVLEIQCRKCGRLVDVFVNMDDFYAWQDGKLIQDALPYLTPDEREIIMSNICGPCFDKMFTEDE